MKIAIKIFISYALILSSILPYTVRAEEALTRKDYAKMMFSPAAVFEQQIGKTDLFLDKGGRVLNAYKMIGMDGIPDESQKKLFRKLVKTNNFVLDHAPSQLMAAGSEYSNAFNSSNGGQIQLKRLMDASINAIIAVKGPSSVDLIMEKLEEHRKAVLAENSIPDDKNKSLKVELEAKRRVLGEFTAEDRAQAKQLIVDNQKMLRNKVSHAKYRYNNGIQTASLPNWKANFSPRNQLANFRGQFVVGVEDPFGRKISVPLDKSAQGLLVVKGSDFMKSLKSGTIQTGRLGAVLMALVLAFSEEAMIRDFQANPEDFYESLQATMNYATVASLGSFFVGGALVDGVVREAPVAVKRALDVSRKSKFTLQALAKNSHIKMTDPDLFKRLVDTQMSNIKANSFLARATSYPGMTGGFLISQFVYKYVESARSCMKVAAGLDDGRYSLTERQYIEQDCDQTMAQITKEIMESPQTWTALVGLLSTKAIITFFMTKLQASRYAYSVNRAAIPGIDGIKGPLRYEVKIGSRGLMVPPSVGLAVKGLGFIGGFVIFGLVFWGITKALEVGVNRLTLNIPAEQAAQNIRDLFRMYRAKGWDMEKLCDDRELLQGGLLEYVKKLAFWRDRTERCGEELVDAVLAQHSQNNQTWRESLTGPITQEINAWTEAVFKATNLHEASYLFYKDVAEQIKAQRNDRQGGQNLTIRRVNNPKTNALESLGYANTHLYNHPLPLFRSEPFFGWDYRLSTDTDEYISYPEWNGGTTTWSERMASRSGSDNLAQRKDKFKNTVLPVALTKLNERLAATTNEAEKKQITKIIAYLTAKKGVTLSLQNVAKGLHLISLMMESQNVLSTCKLNNDCFWVNFQKEFFDGELWSVETNSLAVFKRTGVPDLVTKFEERLTFNPTNEETRVINLILGYWKVEGELPLSNLNSGVYLLSSAFENRRLLEICDEESICFWDELKKSYAGPISKLSPIDGPAEFMEGSDYYAGYQTSADQPFGVKPVGPGQGFFLRYASRLTNNDIDPHYYDPDYTSMTDYLLKQMVCGVDVNAGETMREQTYTDWFFQKVRMDTPEWIERRRDKKVAAEFRAPRIPLNGRFDPCYNDGTNQRWRRSGPPGAPSFYNYIEDKNSPEVSYGGIVDLLYREAGHDFVNNFDQWWQDTVGSQYVDVLENLYQKNFKPKKIDEKLQQVITEDNFDTNCTEVCRDFGFSHKKGVAAALKQEMDTHFNYFFTPLLQDIDLDVSRSDLTDPNAARQKLGSDFIQIRSEIYDIFAYASDRSASLSLPNLVAEYQEILAEVRADVIMQNPEVTPNSDVLRNRALTALFAEKMYDMKVLTKTETELSIMDIYLTALFLLSEMTNLSEEERQELANNIESNNITLQMRFANLDERAGKVTFKYNDLPRNRPNATEADKTLPSPTSVSIAKSQDTIIALMSELFQLQSLKESYSEFK